MLAVAAELGYKPNLLARGLRGSRSSLIGVIARDVSDPFHIQVLQGVNEVTRARDYRLFLGHVDYRPDVALTYGSMFERSHADGIIVLGDLVGGHEARPTSRPSTASSSASRIGPAERSPASTPTARRARSSRSSTCGSSATAGSCACPIPGPRTSACASRCTRVHARARRAGPSARTGRATGPGAELSARSRAARRRRARDPPTAIFATSDTIAIGLIQAAYQTGVVVPDRLSIVGFDNIDIAAFTIPPLTTVSQSGVEMGRPPRRCCST